MPLRSRKDHPLCNARGKEDAEHLPVSELQVPGIQAENLVPVLFQPDVYWQADLQERCKFSRHEKLDVISPILQRNIMVEFDLNHATGRFTVVRSDLDILALASHTDFDHIAPCSFEAQDRYTAPQARSEFSMLEQLGFWS